MVIQNQVVTDALARVTDELAKNPYSDILPHFSTQIPHFIKDAGQDTVNKYQKPLSLYLQLLKMFASPGTVVLDATCGTASLELAAMEESAPKKLEFIAFERNLYQADHASIRLKRSCTKPTSENDIHVDVMMETYSRMG